MHSKHIIFADRWSFIDQPTPIVGHVFVNDLVNAPIVATAGNSKLLIGTYWMYSFDNFIYQSNNMTLCLSLNFIFTNLM